MRNLYRDTQGVWVSLYESKERLIENGEWTGEYLITRSTPFRVFPTITASRGSVNHEVFGIDLSYDRTATFASTDTGITETAVFWLESEPAFDGAGNLIVDSYGQPTVPWDHVVELVAVNRNYTAVALRRVEVR
ncbi:MAG: hypothetical protein J6S63_01265 [Atopobiaceae bacterium]|nr:hypothetical protein [Atopobiaceae bacterium]